MSTRCVITSEKRFEEGKGRYCHFDGYPAGVGNELVELIQKYGTEDVINIIVEDSHFGWSSLEFCFSGDLPDYYMYHGLYDERFEVVEGYGVRYTKDEFFEDDIDEWWVTPFDDMTDYCYVIHNNGVIDIYAVWGKKMVGSIDAYADNAAEKMREVDQDDD